MICQVGRAEVAQLVGRLNKLGADAAVLVGDLADGPPSAIGRTLGPIAELNQSDGVFYVTGNVSARKKLFFLWLSLRLRTVWISLVR